LAAPKKQARHLKIGTNPFKGSGSRDYVIRCWCWQRGELNHNQGTVAIAVLLHFVAISCKESAIFYTHGTQRAWL